jgi:hypothetical protein
MMSTQILPRVGARIPITAGPAIDDRRRPRLHHRLRGLHRPVLATLVGATFIRVRPDQLDTSGMPRTA